MEEETRLLMMQLVEETAFMHNCNVIHREQQPAIERANMEVIDV